MPNLFTQQNFDVDVTHMDSNPSFGSFIAASFARDTGTVHAGAGSLKATWPAPGSPTTRSWVNHAQAITTVAGTRYRVTAWVYVPSGSPDVQTWVVFTAQGGVTSVKDAWHQIAFEFVATGGAHFIGWGPAVSQLGGVMYLDDIYVDVAPHTRQVYTDAGWQDLTRVKWPTP